MQEFQNTKRARSLAPGRTTMTAQTVQAPVSATDERIDQLATSLRGEVIWPTNHYTGVSV